MPCGDRYPVEILSLEDMERHVDGMFTLFIITSTESYERLFWGFFNGGDGGGSSPSQRQSGWVGINAVCGFSPSRTRFYVRFAVSDEKSLFWQAIFLLR